MPAVKYINIDGGMSRSSIKGLIDACSIPPPKSALSRLRQIDLHSVRIPLTELGRLINALKSAYSVEGGSQGRPASGVALYLKECQVDGVEVPDFGVDSYILVRGGMEPIIQNTRTLERGSG